MQGMLYSAMQHHAGICYKVLCTAAQSGMLMQTMLLMQTMMQMQTSFWWVSCTMLAELAQAEHAEIYVHAQRLV